MYHAMAVAHYIIDYCNLNECGISNLKLQKILYFVQAEFLVSTPHHTACFSDRIEAWDFGPVVPSVYHQYKIYGSGIIPSDSNDPLEDYYDVISDEDKVMIDSIVRKASRFSASQLVDITHHQAPWRNAYRKGYNNQITNAAIRNFFGE